MSDDTLFGGAVAFAQPARGAGYRVNVDAILLAGFSAQRGGARKGATHARAAKVVYDLGAGSGGVALSLLHLGAALRVVLVEIDSRAGHLAAKNLASNGWGDRGEVVTADVRSIDPSHARAADLVVCNPPYFDPARGNPAHEESRAAARAGELAPFVDAARMLLGKRGRACFVYPARDLATLFETLRAAGLEPKRMRLVQGDPASPARVALVEALPARPGGLIIEPTLIERVAGAYTPELATLLRSPRVEIRERSRPAHRHPRLNPREADRE